MKKFYILLLAASPVLCNASTLPKYKNPGVGVEARVADLLKRMTLEEKVAQLHGFLAATRLRLTVTAITSGWRTPPC